VSRIFDGGQAVCAQAGVRVAGGHSIDCPEPVYGLAAIGLCREEDIRRDSRAQPGDAIILIKALGVGVHSSAAKKEMLSPGLRGNGRLDDEAGVCAALANGPDVHAMTDDSCGKIGSA